MKGSRVLMCALMVGIFAMALYGCGTDTGSTSSLGVTEKVTVVDSQSSGGSAGYGATSVTPLTFRTATLTSSDLPAGSSYFTDDTEVFVEERSVDAFNKINEILCSIGQTKYQDMLNKGPYHAQIDTKVCGSERDDADNAGKSSQNKSSGSDTPSYEVWTVDSSRADNSSSQILKAWVHQKAEDRMPAQLILAKMVITEGISTSNPYGIFTINFKAYPVINGIVDTSNKIFRGTLKSEIDSSTGKVLLKFINVSEAGMQGMSFTEKAVLTKEGDGTTGEGSLYENETSNQGSNTAQFDIAFDSNHFLRDDGTTSVCLDRTNFDETVWRYGLYDLNGDRVSRDSGFPIKVTQGSTDYFGWVGYWGLWFPEDVTVSDGDTVYQLSYNGNSSGTPYTVFISGGKLIKHTRRTITLADIKNIPLDYHENTSGDDYRVMWDGTNFTEKALLDKTTWKWTNLTTPVTLALTTLDFGELNFFSQAQGGSMQVKLDSCQVNDNGTPTDPSDDTFSCSASDTTIVVAFKEDTLYPGDTVPTSLVCFERCPDVAKIGTSDPDPYVFYSFQDVAPASANNASYTFDSTNFVLKSGSTAVTTTDSTYEYGVQSGPLFEPTTQNLAQVACDWDSTKTCGWQGWSNLSIFYTWETGANEWNHLTALKSGSQYKKFDPPVNVEYTHTGNGYTNAKFYLDYSGFGDLHGIPGKCVDMDTGSDVDCGSQTGEIRWVPEFSIANGSVVTDASNSSVEYLVKGLEKEQRMKENTTGGCASLTTTSYTFPDISEWVNPALGSEPTIESAPAVIGGVLQ